MNNLMPKDLSSMPTSELLDFVRSVFTNIARNFVRLAFAIKELETRNVDLRDLPIAGRQLDRLRMIANGQIAIEVVERFWNSQSAIDDIGRLPLPDQKRLASEKMIPLVVAGPDGKMTHRMIDPANMDKQARAQLLSGGHLRIREEEQIRYLEQQRAKVSKSPPERIGDMRIDVEGQCVWFKRAPIPLAQLEAAVKALRR